MKDDQFIFETMPFAGLDSNPASGLTVQAKTRQIQSALNRSMGLQLPLDGLMNFRTRRAIRKFQRDKGIPADGIVNYATERALIAASSGQSSRAGAAKSALPSRSEPLTSATRSPAAEFDFEDAGHEAYQMSRLSNRSHEFETANPKIPSPKTISRFNTDLNAPYFGGNFNFLYNGGSNEAVITYNTYLSYTKSFLSYIKSFSEPQKRQLINNLINNLKDAVAIWDGAAELQVKDATGNFNDRIRLRFKLNFVTDPKNANKRTQVHPPGSRTVFFIDKDRETVMRDLNIYIGSSKNVLVHELGHVWGLLDEYKDRWISMKLSLGHVGAGSPLIKDKISIMNEGYDRGNTGEFRGRYFKHFGRTILNAFWGSKNHVIPIKQNGKVVARSVQGRIALMKKNIAGSAPFANDVLPFNPQFTGIQVAKK